MLLVQMTSSVDFAILAPVPLAHLESALNVVNDQGRVAFGADGVKFFEDVEGRRAGEPVPVLFYASHPNDAQPDLTTTWRGWYTGFVESAEGRHPGGDDLLPSSAANDGAWAVFWHVEALEPMPAGESIPIGDLVSYKTGEQYKSNFRPRRPVLVQRPV
jgi:hypothetical protein